MKDDALTRWIGRRIALCHEYREATEDGNDVGQRAVLAELIELHRHPPQGGTP